MANDINDFEDFGATDDVIKTNIGDTTKKSGTTKGDLPKSDGDDDSEKGYDSKEKGDSDGEQGDEESEKETDENGDGDSEEQDSESTKKDTESEQEEDGEQEGEDSSEDDVEKKVPESYSSDEEDSDNGGGEDESEEKEGNEQQKKQKDKNNKDKSKDDVVGQTCIALGLVKNDENNYGVVSNFADGDYTIRIPEATPLLHNAKREQIVFVGDYVKFYIGGVEEYGNILGFNITKRTYNIINWKSNERWNDLDIDDINSLAQEDTDDESQNQEEDEKQDEKEDEATKEQNNLEQQNLKRFKSLQFFVKFFLDSDKSKEYRKYIKYYKYGEWNYFHHQSFWLLNQKIVDGLNVLSGFNEEEGDDLAEFINLDNSIMLNINMLGLKNQEILKELSNIKNIPDIFYRIVNERVGIKDFYCSYVSEMNNKLTYELNFAYFGRKIFVFSERVHQQERILKDFFVLNIDKSNKRIYGKVKNSESDKYIFNVYFSNFEKISYYEIFSYICYVLIWKSSSPNQIMNYSEIDNFVKRHLTIAKEILI